MAKSLKEEFTKGIIKENPVLRLMLGTCATLAVTTAASNAIGMGLATTFVLVCSNAVISLLKKIIPDKVRIPAYITIVAGFVTIVQLLIKAYVPALNKSLGVFLPLIVVNCIILGRAEMFASKNPVLPSIVDGLGMGVGFTAALLAMGIKVNSVITVTFIIGSFLAGVGSILYFTNYGQVSPTIGAMPGLKAFVAAVFGGIGSIPGAVLGAYIIGVCESLIKANDSIAIFSNAFTFALLIVVLLFKPNGMFGEKLAEKV